VGTGKNKGVNLTKRTRKWHWGGAPRRQTQRKMAHLKSGGDVGGTKVFQPKKTFAWDQQIGEVGEGKGNANANGHKEEKKFGDCRKIGGSGERASKRKKDSERKEVLVTNIVKKNFADSILEGNIEEGVRRGMQKAGCKKSLLWKRGRRRTSI